MKKEVLCVKYLFSLFGHAPREQVYRCAARPRRTDLGGGKRPHLGRVSLTFTVSLSTLNSFLLSTKRLMPPL